MLVGIWHLSGICLVFILLLQEQRFSKQYPGNRDADPDCYLSWPNLWSFAADLVYIKLHCVYGVGTKNSDLGGKGICSVSNV